MLMHGSFLDMLQDREFTKELEDLQLIYTIISALIQVRVPVPTLLASLEPEPSLPCCSWSACC
jgi:hypothetical protein